LTGPKAIHLENIRSVRAELLQVLEGMDYCLDWKPNPDAWSAREVLYHLVDMPSGGLHTLIQGMVAGKIKEFELTPNLTNLTSERQVVDLEQALHDITLVLNGMEQAVATASEEDLAGKSVLAHLKARGRDEERTAQMLLEGLFARHWREHLVQLRELREALGV
jgi:DinB superfamily